MKFLTLSQIKQQCRIDEARSDEDDYLMVIADAAELAVQQHLNRNLYIDEVPDDDSTGTVITATIHMAMLLMVAQLYENREATSELTMKEVPLTFSYLLEGARVIPV